MVTVLPSVMTPGQAALGGAAMGLQQNFDNQNLQKFIQANEGVTDPKAYFNAIMTSNLPPETKALMIQQSNFQQTASVPQERLAFDKEKHKYVVDQKSASQRAMQGILERMAGIKDNALQQSGGGPLPPETQAGLNELDQMTAAVTAMAEHGVDPGTHRDFKMMLLDHRLLPEDRKHLVNLWELVKPTPLSQPEARLHYDTFRQAGLSPDQAGAALSDKGVSLEEINKIMEFRGETLTQRGKKRAEFIAWRLEKNTDLDRKLKDILPIDPLNGSFVDSFDDEKGKQKLVSYIEQYKIFKEMILKRALRDGYVDELGDDYLRSERTFMTNILLDNGIPKDLVDKNFANFGSKIVGDYNKALEEQGITEEPTQQPDAQPTQQPQTPEQREPLEDIMKGEIESVKDELEPGVAEKLLDNEDFSELDSSLELFEEADKEQAEIEKRNAPKSKREKVLEKNIKKLEELIEKRERENKRIPREVRKNLQKLKLEQRKIKASLNTERNVDSVKDFFGI